MASKRETVLAALDVVLAAAMGALGADYRRNDVLPTRIDPAGLVILRDGDPGEPEVWLSPRGYYYEHRAELEVFVQSESDREGLMDAILMAVAAALAVDRSLGGLCDWVEPEAPAPSDVPVEAGAPFRGVTVAIVLAYSTTDPLM